MLGFKIIRNPPKGRMIEILRLEITLYLLLKKRAMKRTVHIKEHP